MEVEGASGRLKVAGDGSLQIPTSSGSVTLEKPGIYQEIGGRRVAVSGGYQVTGCAR